MNSPVVSDTSCLIVLDKIGCLFILERLFSQIVVPIEVSEEFGKDLPDWVNITQVANLNQVKILQPLLDKGEAHAITLAKELEARLIIDEKKGRAVAQSMGIPLLGTVGILALALKARHLTDPIEVIAQLKMAGFYMSAPLEAQLNGLKK